MSDRLAGPQTHGFALLDGLRGLGAVIVLIGHTVDFWGLPYLPTGAICVDMFFLISGFVIAYAYEPRFARGMGVGEFMQHRIVRLYPLYLLSIILMVLFVLACLPGDADAPQRVDTLARQLPSQLAMLPTVDSDAAQKLYPLNGPAWTLLVELAANLVYVVIWRHLTTLRLAMLVGACAVGLVAAILVYGDIDSGALWSTAPAGFARSFFGFFAGVLVFRLAGSPGEGPRRHASWLWLTPLVIPLSAFAPVPDAYVQAYQAVLVIVVASAVLYIAQSIQPPRFLCVPFAMLGGVSYAAYILHYPFREALMRLHWRWPDLQTDYSPLIGMVFVAVVVFVSWCAERWYDRPVRRYIVGLIRAQAARRGVSAIAPPSRRRSAASRH